MKAALLGAYWVTFFCYACALGFNVFRKKNAENLWAWAGLTVNVTGLIINIALSGQAPAFHIFESLLLAGFILAGVGIFCSRQEEKLPDVRFWVWLEVLLLLLMAGFMEAWRPLLYADEDQKAKDLRDPVALAKRSDSAMKKINTKRLDDGSRIYSFRSLLGHLGAIVRATCRCSGGENTSATFTMITRRNLKQQKAFDLLQTIRV